MANSNESFFGRLNSNNLLFLPVPWIQGLPVEHKNKEKDKKGQISETRSSHNQYIITYRVKQLHAPWTSFKPHRD